MKHKKHSHKEMMNHSHHEHKPMEGYIDNRMVHDNHQGGISRVMQRRHDRMDVKGHNGKMGKGDMAHWSRKGDPLTPRKA